MPLVDWNDAATFNTYYRLKGEKDGTPNTREPLILHYNRSVVYPIAAAKIEGVAAALGWSPPGPTICILGAGYGYSAEALEALGYTAVVGVDTSTYIQSTKTTTETTEIEDAITGIGLDPNSGRGAILKTRHDDGGARQRNSRGVLADDVTDIDNQTARAAQRAVRNALGLSGNQTPDVVMTELMLSSFTDAELTSLLTRLHSWVTPLIHIVWTLPDPVYNSKTLAEWKSFSPADTFVDWHTFEVL